MNIMTCEFLEGTEGQPYLTNSNPDKRIFVNETKTFQEFYFELKNKMPEYSQSIEHWAHENEKLLKRPIVEVVGKKVTFIDVNFDQQRRDSGMYMSHGRAKEIISLLGLTGIEFAEMLGKNKNYVSDFKRYGVPDGIAMTLSLAREFILRDKITKEEILEVLRGKKAEIAS